MAAHEHQHDDDFSAKCDMKVLKTSSKNIITTADTNSGNNNDKLKKSKDKRAFSSQAVHNISAIGIIAGFVAIIVIIIAYSLYPSMFSSTLALFSWFTHTNTEVIFSPPNTDLMPTVTFGAILPLSGISSSLGEAEEAAYRLQLKMLTLISRKSIQLQE